MEQVPLKRGRRVSSKPNASPSRDSKSLDQLRGGILSAADLQRLKFEDPVAYVEGLVLEGLTVLGGKPKLGKSWWVLRAGLTIASGGIAFDNPHRIVKQSSVLYLALEDGPRRLQTRLQALSVPGELWPETLSFTTQWRRFDKGGLESLVMVIDENGYQVVIIDTLARVRKPRRGGGDAYQEDTDSLAQIHDLVRERPGLAVLVVHHNRKNDELADYIDALSGTTGITGAADHIAVLQRGRGKADGIVRFTSRDAEEHDTAFSFDRGVWRELGDAAVYQQSQERQALLHALADAFKGEARLKDLAGYLEKAEPTIHRQLRALESEGLVVQEKSRGPWRVAKSANSANWKENDLGDSPVDLAVSDVVVDNQAEEE